MNFDPGMVNQVLNAIPYPVGKAQIIQLARQAGANDQIIGMLDHLPDKTFNSAQEVQNSFQGLGGGLGNLGNIGGLFK